MASFEIFNKQQLQKLTLGSLGILAIYCVSGVIHEYLQIVEPYNNRRTGEPEILTDRSVLIFFPCLVTWIIGALYNRTLPNRVAIPQKNSLYCAIVVFISTITYTWAVAKTSFPVVMAFKSCNLLSVLLVAILCTRVKEKNLTLGPDKIFIGIAVSIGVFLFSFFDPQSSGRTQANEAIGIVFLFLSLMADGFLPDFQAEIKSVYKPQPTEMMESINKWVAIISLVSIFGSFSANRVLSYVLTHPMFMVHLIGMSLLSCLGQFVVYYMIKQFKQHIVPFIITLRKILTIGISILFYGHQTSILQLLGIVIVLGSVVLEFSNQIKSKTKQRRDHVRVEHLEKFELVEEDDSLLEIKQAEIGDAQLYRDRRQLKL